MDMRGVFDDEDVEPAKATQETELTLSSTVLLGIVLGLVAICGLCFSLGYMAGHRDSQELATGSRPDATAPTTLQADSSRSKPSAITQVPAAPAPSPGSAADAVPAGADPDAGPIANSPSPSSAPSAGPSGAQQAQVRPALPSAAYSGQPVQQQAVQPALAPTSLTMVQIAAVANRADAVVLVNALRRRGYATFARREPADGLIHVRIGPFSSRDVANQWRLKLLSDGYNAIVQP
jgi:DedD protein